MKGSVRINKLLVFCLAIASATTFSPPIENGAIGMGYDELAQSAFGDNLSFNITYVL